MLPDFTKYLGLQFAKYNCYGLVKYVFSQELGVTIPSLDVPSNSSRKVYFTYLHQVASYWEPIDNLADLQVFDVIAMAYLPTHPKIIQHFGVYVGNNKMLHTLDKVNAHIVPLNHPAVKNTIRGAYRWKQLSL